MKKFLFLVLFFAPFVPAQEIPEPVYNSGIYEYLENLSLKGIITLNENIKPFTRIFIAEKLLTAELNSLQMTPLEKEYLEFYKKEYFYEIQRFKNQEPIRSVTEIARTGESGRWRLFKYNDKNFHAYLDPIIGLDFLRRDNVFVRHRRNGLKAGGYIGSNWGFYLDLRDNEDFGLGRDSMRAFTPITGTNFVKETKSSFEYSEVKAGLTWSWKTGSISLKKEFINWGSGRGGQIIFSSKAPSFPFFEINLHPASWLDFTYIHGFLQSGLVDSSSIRYTPVQGRKDYSDIPKFIASHMISFHILDNLNVSLGESVVYTDHVEPIYFIPVMFFRMADHYMMHHGSNSGDNAQLFADAYYKNSFLRTKFYTTVFIDELSVTGMLQGVKLSAVGFTSGIHTADPVFKNSSIIVEYTRINPFVYMNSNDAQTYTNHGYQLGHWIGSNADQLFISYDQKILRGLETSLSAQLIRKGKKELPEEQYQLPYPDFLYGQRTDHKIIQFKISYEIVNDLIIRAYYLNDVKNSFALGTWYGL